MRKPVQQDSVNRSEQLRQRRTQTSQQRVTRAKSSAVRQPRAYQATAPVMSRGYTANAPTFTKRGANSRRHVSVPFGNGAEVIVRNLPVIRPGWRLFSGLLLIVLSAVLFYVLTSPAYQVSAVSIQGNKRLKKAELAEVANLQNRSIFSVDPQKVTQSLAAAFPDLKSISTEVKLPAQVNVTIVERKPVMEWMYNDNRVWVDADGLLFLPRKEDKAKGVIVINADGTPPEFNAAVNLETDETQPTDTSSAKAQAPSKAQPAQDGQSTTALKHIDPTLMLTIVQLSTLVPSGTEISYSAKDGLGWSAKEGWVVYVGSDLANLDRKMMMYQSIVKYLDKEKKKPALISVQTLDAPYYRMEK